ncbi:MAG: hypothetical protein IPM21_18225 [Acidobacteria bacterium]|nr:hypothetical protein [Acidobacteriota bacterium]
MKEEIVKTQTHIRLFLINLFILAGFHPAFAQSFCDAAGDLAADNASLPWKLRTETKTGTWATAMKPVIQEMRRLFPEPPKGLQVTYGIFDAMGIQTSPKNARQYYEGFFMIKDIVCYTHQGKNVIGPEGETGNWIYFRVNDFKGFAVNGNSGDLVLAGTELRLNMSGDIRIEENKNGMRSIYFFNENDEQQFSGWYFSERKALPYRRVTREEFARSYREYWLKKIDGEINRLEGVLATSQRTFTRVSAERGIMTDAEKQRFFQSLREGDQKTQQAIDQYKARRSDAIRFTDVVAKSPDSGSEAFVANFNEILNQPSEIRFGSGKGKGKFVYVANPAFYDPRLPKWKPQVITVELRRQDTSPAKTAFTNKFEDEFDFNVIRKMVGMSPLPKPPTITGMGDTPVRETGRPVTKNSSNAENGAGFFEDFADSAIGQAPAKWTLSNNTGIVKKNPGQSGNWLAMSKEGLFFPDYAVLALPNSFTVEFDVTWTKNISYYSPSFYFHLGAAPYDNTLKRYDRALVNLNAYTSSRMERVALWIDPHWNNEHGRYGLQVFDARGGYKLDKADKTKIYFKDKNLVKVKLVRQGSLLSIFFNGTKMSEDAVLSENIRWNFFGFGVDNAPNADPSDEFYVSNIRLSK